jgi:hypothetical protein
VYVGTAIKSICNINYSKIKTNLPEVKKKLSRAFNLFEQYWWCFVLFSVMDKKISRYDYNSEIEFFHLFLTLLAFFSMIFHTNIVSHLRKYCSNKWEYIFARLFLLSTQLSYGLYYLAKHYRIYDFSGLCVEVCVCVLLAIYLATMLVSIIIKEYILAGLICCPPLLILLFFDSYLRNGCGGYVVLFVIVASVIFLVLGLNKIFNKLRSSDLTPRVRKGILVAICASIIAGLSLFLFFPPSHY